MVQLKRQERPKVLTLALSVDENFPFSFFVLFVLLFVSSYLFSESIQTKTERLAEAMSQSII